MEMVGRHGILSAIVGATCTVTSCAIAIGLPLSMGAGSLRGVVDRRLCVARQCVKHVEIGVCKWIWGAMRLCQALSCFLLNFVTILLFDLYSI